MDTIQTCRHAIAMLEDEQSMTGWSDAHTAALRLAVQFLVNSTSGEKLEAPRDAHRVARWGLCVVCRHDCIPDEGCARVDCPDAPPNSKAGLDNCPAPAAMAA